MADSRTGVPDEGRYQELFAAFCQQNHLDLEAAMAPVHYRVTGYRAKHGYRLERAEDWAKGVPVAGVGAAPILRFGNSLQQITNALHLARSWNVRNFYFDRHPLLDFASGRTIGGTNFHNEFPIEFSEPAFIGVFYDLKRLFSGPGPSTADRRRMCHDVLWPLFSQDITRPALAIGPSDVVAHFRSGDIFSDSIPHNVEVRRFYGQPPASFYTAAVAHAVQDDPAARVVIVFEDRNNPCVALLEAWCEAHEISCVSYSGALVSDLSILLQARRLVFSWGSFLWAVGLMAPNLQTAYWFDDNHWARDIASAANLTSYCVKDSRQAFIKRGDWFNTEANMRELIEYPETALSLEKVRSGI